MGYNDNRDCPVNVTETEIWDGDDMLLFSTILDINELLTKERFIELVFLWNQSAKYKENIVEGVFWNGEKNIKFGTDKLSIEIIDSVEKDILSVLH